MTQKAKTTTSIQYYQKYLCKYKEKANVYEIVSIIAKILNN